MSDYNLKRRPVVALAGRPNVGKSTFFNLLSKKQKSIVHEHPGVTRDRIVGHITRPELDLEFDLVDTGGLFYGEDLLMEDIKTQTERALSDADVILHMVDCKSGLLPDDKRVAEQLRMLNKSVILVANKSDSDKLAQNSVEFYELGYKN